MEKHSFHNRKLDEITVFYAVGVPFNVIIAPCFLSFTLYCIMFPNGQAHFINLAPFAARFLNCVLNLPINSFQDGTSVLKTKGLKFEMDRQTKSRTLLKK